MAQLGIGFLGRTHRLRHRLPQQLAVALAEALDRFPDRLDTQAELGSGGRVGRTFFVAREINLKRGKLRDKILIKAGPALASAKHMAHPGENQGSRRVV